MPQVKCKICSTEFYVKPSHQKAGFGKYCSHRCQYEGQKKGRFVDCFNCGEKTWKTPKDLRKSKSNKFFCSKSCQTKWRNKHYSGNKHPNWKGGKFKDYRNILLKKDKLQVCKICGINDKRVIIVHHIDKNRHNNKKNNLIWLCLNCHYLVHNYNKKIQ